MTRRPPKSTLFPYRRSSDLAIAPSMEKVATKYPITRLFPIYGIVGVCFWPNNGHPTGWLIAAACERCLLVEDPHVYCCGEAIRVLVVDEYLEWSLCGNVEQGNS